MSFDLRFPVGLMFSVFGLIVSAVGLIGPAAYVEQSLGVNINLWWGLVMLAFGLFMLVSSLAGRKGGE